MVFCTHNSIWRRKWKRAMSTMKWNENGSGVLWWKFRSESMDADSEIHWRSTMTNEIRSDLTVRRRNLKNRLMFRAHRPQDIFFSSAFRFSTHFVSNETVRMQGFNKLAPRPNVPEPKPVIEIPEFVCIWKDVFRMHESVSCASFRLCFFF